MRRALSCGMGLAVAGSLLVQAADPVKVGAPAIFWASNPTAPGETELLYGSRLDHPSSIRLQRVEDGAAGTPADEASPAVNAGENVSPVQVSDRCLKFVLPAAKPDGVYRVTIETNHGKTVAWINRPEVEWVQASERIESSPGGVIRVFGKSLGTASLPATILLRNNAGHAFEFKAKVVSPFALTATVPPEMPEGAYRLYVHNGAGGREGWSVPATCTISTPPVQPKGRFSVSPSTGSDDTSAIQRALDQAGAAGGGRVTLKAGTYKLGGGLNIPPKVALVGESEEKTLLDWNPDMPPPPVLVRVTSCFALEDMTIVAKGSCVGIENDLKAPRDPAGWMRIRHVVLKLNPHLDDAGQPIPGQAGIPYPLKHCDAISLKGSNLEISHCHIYSKGKSLNIDNSLGVWIHDNEIRHGLGGWYCLSGQNFIVEDNDIAGTDPNFGGGGGVNTLAYVPVTQNIYFARNGIHDVQGGAREAMTTDGPGGPYCGPVTSAHDNQLTLPAAPVWGKQMPDVWMGAGVFILSGTGQGQYRQLTGADGLNLTVDSPWVVPPAADSIISVAPLERHQIYEDNRLQTAGVAIQFYGSSCDMVVHHNTSIDAGGFRNSGRVYHHGVQPSWFIQWLDNTVQQTPNPPPNTSRGKPIVSGIQVLAAGGKDAPVAPMVLGIVVRGNDLQDGSAVNLQARGMPPGATGGSLLQEVVVEKNKTTAPVKIEPGVSGVDAAAP